VRSLTQWGWACVTEMPLPNRRRADVMGLSAKGEIVIIEVKSGLADFRADGKWQDYLPYCDHFAFAVDETFPQQVLPFDVGLVICDGWDAEILRPWDHVRLHASRRKSMTLAFARTAAQRLSEGGLREALLTKP
jgi:hypothetical protein